MSKFVRILVSKKSTTDLYVEVQDDFDISGGKGFAAVRKLPLSSIANDTTKSHDWQVERIYSNLDLEVEEVEVVDEKEAKQYIYWSEIEHKKCLYQAPR